VTFYRRRLPHFAHTGAPIFITWRLHGSLLSNRLFPSATVTSGEAFAVMDRLLDETRTGPAYLRMPEIASVVVEAIHYNAEVLRHYSLDSYVVIPNHVHILVRPHVSLPKLTRSLKGITGKNANELLHMTGKPFWQDESYDRVVRNSQEFERIQHYIEWNPVRAGLVNEPGDYWWSSARAAGGPPAGQGARPTTDHLN
jgi:putative transposase